MGLKRLLARLLPDERKDLVIEPESTVFTGHLPPSQFTGGGDGDYYVHTIELARMTSTTIYRRRAGRWIDIREPAATDESCWCPCHTGGECLRGDCCYGPRLCNSERNRGAVCR